MSCITIDKNKCKSCYLCIEACPLGLIQKSKEAGDDGEFVAEFVDTDSKCVACAKCATVCPHLAIVEVVRNE